MCLIKLRVFLQKKITQRSTRMKVKPRNRSFRSFFNPKKRFCVNYCITKKTENGKNEVKMQLKNKCFIYTAATRRALRIALQSPVFYLDLYREAGYCLYRLSMASSLRESSRRRLLESQGQQESQGGRV